jgi:hypothetical protein
MRMPELQLINGFYILDLHLGDGMTELETVPDAFKVNVEPRDFSGTGLLPRENLNVFYVKNVEWKLVP